MCKVRALSRWLHRPGPFVNARTRKTTKSFNIALMGQDIAEFLSKRSRRSQNYRVLHMLNDLVVKYLKKGYMRGTPPRRGRSDHGPLPSKVHIPVNEAMVAGKRVLARIIKDFKDFTVNSKSMRGILPIPVGLVDTSAKASMRPLKALSCDCIYKCRPKGLKSRYEANRSVRIVRAPSSRALALMAGDLQVVRG